MDGSMGHDFNLHSMLNSSHDEYDNFPSIPDHDHYTELSASPPPLSNHYIDEFTGTLNKRKSTSLLETKDSKIWKEMPHESPYHPRKPINSHQSNNVLIVVDKNPEDEEEELNAEPFDYSIFLNKPSSPAREEEEEEEVVPIQEEREEVVVDEPVISEEKVDQLLTENQVFFGNVCPPSEKKEDGFFHCELCSLKFNRKGNYKRHRLTHFVKSKRTPYRYQCQVCERNFLQRCDLMRHMHVHTDTHPYKCDECGNGYLRKKDLEIHIGFHLGEKKYKCDQCTKAFYSNGDLRRHVRSSHCKEEKLRCGHCDGRFSRESTLLQHMQRKHNETILSVFKEQVCKLQEMPSVVKIDTVPFKLNTMTSPVTGTESASPALDVASTSPTISTSGSSVTSSTSCTSSTSLTSLTVTASSSSSTDFSNTALDLTLGTDVNVTSSSQCAVTAPERVMTSPVRVDDVTSFEARSESAFT